MAKVGIFPKKANNIMTIFSTDIFLLNLLRLVRIPDRLSCHFVCI